MMPRVSSAIPVAERVRGFSYAIRNIVAEARKIEASGRTVRYLNIGDPIIFGFRTPPHMIEAVERAMRDWQVTNRSGAHGTHRYTAEQFGLSTTQLRDDYDFYIKHFDVAVEDNR